MITARNGKYFIFARGGRSASFDTREQAEKFLARLGDVSLSPDRPRPQGDLSKVDVIRLNSENIVMPNKGSHLSYLEELSHKEAQKSMTAHERRLDLYAKNTPAPPTVDEVERAKAVDAAERLALSVAYDPHGTESDLARSDAALRAAKAGRLDRSKELIAQQKAVTKGQIEARLAAARSDLDARREQLAADEQALAEFGDVPPPPPAPKPVTKADYYGQFQRAGIDFRQQQQQQSAPEPSPETPDA